MYLNPLSTRMLSIGTYDYPYKSIYKPFIEIFNFYDAHTNGEFTLTVSAGVSAKSILNFNSYPLVILDKSISLISDSFTDYFYVNTTNKCKLLHPEK
jgi:hypothetical protein